MAKSERRSKWKRKFRAIKREKNSVKELESLKKVLKNDRITIENLMRESQKPDAKGKYFFQVEKKTLESDDYYFKITLFYLKKRKQWKLKKTVAMLKSTTQRPCWTKMVNIQCG